jgi:hypothetical protein
MKTALALVALALPLAFPSLKAQPPSPQIPRLESLSGAAEQRAALAEAAKNNPDSIPALTRYAEFLDRHGDPTAREVYGKLFVQLRMSGDKTEAGAIGRRLLRLDLLAGDSGTVSRDLEAYRAVTGDAPHLAVTPSGEAPTILIPGPLRPFARMSAVNVDTPADEILPALARNVVTGGYHASGGNEGLEPTEFLKLVHRYLSQARELDKLAGAEKVIRVESCEAPIVADLLRILGFRMRGGCGSDLVLETVNAPRAFLTTDSGFPVNELETALRTNRPFAYDFHPAAVPVLFSADYWFAPPKEGKEKEPQSTGGTDFVENFISEPTICRLYLGLAKLDRETAESLRKNVSFARLKAYGHVLDFFGGMFEIRNGHAVVPGGQRSAQAWAELSGVSPDNGPAFFERLIARDDGWLASLFDALARIRGPVRDYLTDPPRLKRFYSAVRGRVTVPGPARPVFRSNTDMMLLTTRLRLEANGQPHIPGGLDVWKALFMGHHGGKYDLRLSRLAKDWKDPDDVIEGLFALSRKGVENEPLKIFMALGDIDRNRATPLGHDTVDRLARGYRVYGHQYSIFSESRSLSDRSIQQYLDTADAISRARDVLFRADAAATFQALMSLWQIFVRQNIVSGEQADAIFSKIAASFAEIHGNRELFDAGRAGVKLLIGDTPAGRTEQRVVGLLAGAAESQDTDAREEAALEMSRILEAQQMISLDTLFELADQVENLPRGGKLNTALVNRLAARINEIPAPRGSLSTAERNTLAFGYWTTRHVEIERKLNIRSVLEKASAEPEKLKEVRGELAPFLRDELVALNYAYYAPPGAQVLYTNPVFVRSHDFIGGGDSPARWESARVYGTGWPSNGGGRLMGSLAGLPYALAEIEQNFLVPSHTQALIWTDLVPQLIVSATAPRWWAVTSEQVHWVGLHLRYARELLAESAFDAGLRSQVLASLGQWAAPGRTAELGQWIEQGEVRRVADSVTPAEMFSVAGEFASRPGPPVLANSAIAAELRQLAAAAPETINYAAISRAFGTPKPTLANSYQPEMLNLRTFPALMGYSSRILAESWESNTIYWAALADEISLPPAQLNLRIPEWTEKQVERIFASHLEDWPAVLRSLLAVGDDVRSHNRAAAVEEQKAQLQQYPIGR